MIPFNDTNGQSPTALINKTLQYTNLGLKQFHKVIELSEAQWAKWACEFDELNVTDKVNEPNEVN